MVERHDLFIGGSPSPAGPGNCFEVENPATGETLFEFAAGDAADVDVVSGHGATAGKALTR